MNPEKLKEKFYETSSRNYLYYIAAALIEIAVQLQQINSTPMGA